MLRGFGFQGRAKNASRTIRILNADSVRVSQLPRYASRNDPSGDYLPQLEMSPRRGAERLYSHRDRSKSTLRHY